LNFHSFSLSFIHSFFTFSPSSLIYSPVNFLLFLLLFLPPFFPLPSFLSLSPLILPSLIPRLQTLKPSYPPHISKHTHHINQSCNHPPTPTRKTKKAKSNRKEKNKKTPSSAPTSQRNSKPDPKCSQCEIDESIHPSLPRTRSYFRWFVRSSF